MLRRVVAVRGVRRPARGGRTAGAVAHAIPALLALGVLALGGRVAAQVPAVPPTEVPVPPAKVPVSPATAPQTVPKPPPSTAAAGISRWFNPATAPFIPIPEVAADPDNGTTIGLIPTWLKTDEQHDIRQIIAPDIIHNPYFGYGVHGRIYDYPSTDEQWSLIGGIKQRVERSIDGEYQTGRLRDRRWSVNLTALYDRDGTPRFYGTGNDSSANDQTNFTGEQEVLQAQVGLNLTQAWQLRYTLRLRAFDVLPGTLPRIPSIYTLFPAVRGLHTTKELLHRLAIVYDTRDDVTVPTRGMEWVAYGGLASRAGILNDSLYSEAGVDGRVFWPIARNSILAAHMALRYMPAARDAPFWALSTLGGSESLIGGTQPLRGYGAGRFYDRNAFSATVELRQRIGSIGIAATRLELEVAPFLDMGRVFSRLSLSPVSDLHKVIGVGFRGVARPFVVGYVDVGYGNEGAAVFSGIGYPF
ncbi:MAG TPA: BamA/TamA family outer membrane protein [Steroidobacteraceae bacterium]|nr:BamA/TamA family outer membrane protein [Steroidobacteraceae bacterium]